MKLLGIDYGAKNVGIASTDESGEFALPRTVLQNDENLLKAIEKICRDENISKVVLGESKNFQGNDNQIQSEILEFKKSLESSGLVVVFHPEIMTSLEAQQIQGSNQMLDASAAALILKSFIDTNK